MIKHAHLTSIVTNVRRFNHHRLPFFWIVILCLFLGTDGFSDQTDDLTVKTTFFDTDDSVLREAIKYSKKKRLQKGMLRQVTDYDSYGRVVSVEQFFDTSLEKSDGVKRTFATYSSPGNLIRFEREFDKFMAEESGVWKSIWYLDENEVKTKAELYYTESNTEQAGIEKIAFHYNPNGDVVFEEIYNTPERANSKGYIKSINYFDRLGVRLKEMWVMNAAYIEKEQVKTVTFFYDANGRETKQEGVFTDKKALELGYYKTNVFHDQEGHLLKEERFYYPKSPYAKSYFKGVLTFDKNGEVINEERYDKFGRKF